MSFAIDGEENNEYSGANMQIKIYLFTLFFFSPCLYNLILLLEFGQVTLQIFNVYGNHQESNHLYATN
jgi:hypothetical protein